MIRLNHKTQKFRLVEGGVTVARVDEIELGNTKSGMVTRGYVYTEDGRRVFEAQVTMGKVPTQFKQAQVFNVRKG